MGIISDIVNGAAKIVGNLADTIEDAAGDWLANPVDTGEVLFDFAVGSDQQPPNRLREMLNKRGFEYVETLDIGKICFITGYGIPEVGAIRIAAASATKIALGIVGTASFAGCGLAAAVNEYGSWAGINCKFNNAYIFARWATGDITIIPWCE